MCAAIDNVHHRHGQSVGVATADIFIEGQVEIVGGSLGNSQRYAEDGVGAEIRLGVGAVEGKHGFVDGNLIEGAHAYESGCNGTVDIGNSFLHTLAHVAALVAVAEFKSFIDAGGCARRNGSTTFGAGFEDYVYFYRGVTARVEDFATDDFFDFHNLVVGLNTLSMMCLIELIPDEWPAVLRRAL